MKYFTATNSRSTRKTQLYWCLIKESLQTFETVIDLSFLFLYLFYIMDNRHKIQSGKRVHIITGIIEIFDNSFLISSAVAVIKSFIIFNSRMLYLFLNISLWSILSGQIYKYFNILRAVAWTHQNKYWH